MICSRHVSAITQPSLELDYWNTELEERCTTMEKLLFLFFKSVLACHPRKTFLTALGSTGYTSSSPQPPEPKKYDKNTTTPPFPLPLNVTQACEEGFLQSMVTNLSPFFTMRNTRSGSSICIQPPKCLPSSSFSMNISAMWAPVSSGLPHFLGWSNRVQNWMDYLRK